MPYKVFATGDVLTAADMNAVTADPQSADVATIESTSSTSYTDLATSGPAVSMSLAAGQSCLVLVEYVTSGSAATTGYMSFAVSGAGSQAASDPNAAQANPSTVGLISIGRSSVFAAGAAGTYTFTAKYRANTAVSVAFQARRIIVKKF